MKIADELSFCFGSLREHRLRAFLSALGIAIGVAAMILLTSIGQGTREFVIGEFQQFGTSVLQVSPGKTETLGLPGVMGGTTHKLTIDDAEALRRVRGISQVVPIAFGQARVAAEGRGRSVYVFGVNSEAPQLWNVRVAQGLFLPEADPRKSAPVAVLGPGLKRELFGDRNAVGSWVRIAGWRLRVIGVMESKGRLLGFDMDDCVYIPVASAMAMFNLEELYEINVLFAHESMTDSVVEGVRATLQDRHDGREDFTILTQAAMLEIFDDVLRMITAGVVAIAAISLLVGAVGILTVMWISVGERTREIGLLRAIGTTMQQIRQIFLIEAGVLASVGGLVGLLFGIGVAHLLGALIPGLSVSTPPSFAIVALLVSAATGLISGLAPAHRAAQLHPIDALRAG